MMKILLIFAFFAHVPFQAKANTYLNPANLTSLSDRFGYLKNSFGDNNDDVPEVISGPTSVNMNRGQSPGLMHWIRLGSYEFKVTIEDLVKNRLSLQQVLSLVKNFRGKYLEAFAIVSEPGKDGIAFYDNLGGAAGHGGQNYINLISDPWDGLLAHEAGHALEQRARSIESDILERWSSSIDLDNISVSGYGNTNSWEDLAEFSMIYAFCLDDRGNGVNKLSELREASFQRFQLFEHILSIAQHTNTEHPSVSTPPVSSPPSVSSTSMNPTEEPLVEYNCVESVDFIPDTTQGEVVCGSISDVLKICKDLCSEIGCTGFFYQEHSNNVGCSSSPQGGHQICGFTTAKDFTTVYHGHRKGSQVCSLMPACFDDESFKHKNKSNGTCKKFLENKKKRKRRCGSWDKRTGRHVKNHCPKTCDHCTGMCLNNSEAEFNIKKKKFTCDTVPKKKCTKKTKEKKLVREICRQKCNFCA